MVFTAKQVFFFTIYSGLILGSWIIFSLMHLHILCTLSTDKLP